MSDQNSSEPSSATFVSVNRPELSGSHRGWIKARKHILRQYRRLSRPREIDIDGIAILMDYEGWSPLMISRLLSDSYEVEERQITPSILQSTDRVLEIGGAIGLISMISARIVGEENVFVYEANPEVLEVANRNYARNGFKMRAHHGAVVNDAYEGETVSFFVHENFWSSSLIEKEGVAQAIHAPAVRFNALAQKHRPTALVVDVEGAEYDILMNADLSSFQKLCIEFHTRYIGVEKASQLLRSILERGFFVNLDKSRAETLVFTRAGG